MSYSGDLLAKILVKIQPKLGCHFLDVKNVTSLENQKKTNQ